jgi:ubiquinol-cytochrome c reductase cytochrome c subunit
VSRRRLALVTALVALAAGGVALAQPPQGIVRPTGEASKPLLQLGSQLYAGNCSSCHGIDGRGVYPPHTQAGAGDIKGEGPSLRGVGAQAVDFYLRTGFMPLGNANEEPYRQRVLFSDREIRAMTAYVASLSPGPPIPRPDPASGSVSHGLELFTEHCAGCHQVVAEGGYVTNARVPPIKNDSSTEIAEAVRVGPYLMPKFSAKAISDRELNSIVAYVNSAKRPADPGGWGLGHIGPVPEGLVAWFIAGVVLVVTCVAIGTRLRA